MPPTATGGDSNLYINADTGNVVWHSVPIVDPGRGLSSVVNLTYNSLDQGGMLGRGLAHDPILNAGPESLDDLASLSYAEAGPGFSISVSGPTRINEPLRGVILAAAAEEHTTLDGVQVPSTAEGLKIALTDADGTEHTFTNQGGRWVPPPGLNMRLRRYRTGGTPLDPVPDKWALTRPDGVTHFFDNDGFQTATKDRNGNTLTYEYERVNAFDGAACVAGDVLGKLVMGEEPKLCTQRLTRVLDPEGRALTISYRHGGFLDAPLEGMTPEMPVLNTGVIGGRGGRISKITDVAGRTYEFCYDDDGFLEQFTEAANRDDKRSTGFGYEPKMRGLHGVGDDRPLNRVAELDEPDEPRTQISYPDRESTLPAPDEARPGRRPDFLLKRSSVIKSFRFVPAEGGSPEQFEVTDDISTGNGVRDATTIHTIDERGRPIKVTDPVGNSVALTWNDAENKVARMTKAPGTTDESVTDYAYDGANGTGVLESQTEYPSWPTQTDKRTTDLVWAFGPGQYVSSAPGSDDAAGHFVADLDKLENPKPGTGWDFTFDARGNVTERADAKGKTATTVYDNVGRITDEFDEVGGHVHYQDFHATGQPQTVIDERTNTWRYRYDAVGNVLHVVDPRGSEPVAEGNPYTTTLSYDSFDRLVHEHLPKVSNPGMTVDPSETRFVDRSRTFDRNGNVTSSTDGAGQTTEIDYTPMDLPSHVTEPGSAGGPETTTYVYDLGDRLIGRIDPKGDASSDDVKDAHPAACGYHGTIEPMAFVTRFCLDAAGRVLAQVRYSTRDGDPAALITSYAYDRRDNLVGMVDPNRNLARNIRQAIKAARDPAKQRMAYAYDKVDERTSDTEFPTELKPGTTEREDPTRWQYGYDANGNQTTIVHPRGDQIRTELSYDHRDQLIATKDPLGHLTCLERQADGLVIGRTTPRGTAGAESRCLPLSTKNLRTPQTAALRRPSGWVRQAPTVATTSRCSL
jgi:YD repeat-containing protein